MFIKGHASVSDENGRARRFLVLLGRARVPIVKRVLDDRIMRTPFWRTLKLLLGHSLST